MRHLWSLLAGVVAAPLTWLFLATGQHRAQAAVEEWDTAARFDTADLIGPVVFLAVAGILLGLIGTLRWSPAGPVAAGVLLTIPTVLMFIDPFRTLEGFFRPADEAPRRFLGQDLEPWLPVENGTLLVLGALLLMAIFSAQRWRRWPAAAAAPSPAAAPLPMASDAEVVSGISALSGTAGSGPSASTASGDEDTTRARPTMTDDEILAAAAAYESTASTPTAGRPADEEDETRSSDPGGGSRGVA